MAKKLKICLTAGIGSDHVDLESALQRKITVAEVTFCNSISVAEHVVSTMELALLLFVSIIDCTPVPGDANSLPCTKLCPFPPAGD